MRSERLPASSRAAMRLKEMIEKNEFKPGEWLPTERELASLFRADRSTIRAALAQLAEWGLIVREPGKRPFVRIAENIDDGKVSPRAAGASLQTIAAIIPQPRNYPALGLIQSGILRMLRHRQPHYQLIVFDNQGDIWSQSVEMERQALEVVAREGVAGAILWSIGGDETAGDIARIQRNGIPLVLLDRHPEELACDFVGIDNVGAARDAVTYLLDLGHERIAHLTSDSDLITVREREDGYREALALRGITPSENLICRVADHDDLYPSLGPVVDKLLALPQRPTALFAMKDLLAHAFIKEFTARGFRVPDDISVIGFDDQDRYSLQPPFLTTVHQPFDQLGERAADLLMRRLNTPSGATTPLKHVLVPTPLVIRSSCKVVAQRTQDVSPF